MEAIIDHHHHQEEDLSSGQSSFSSSIQDQDHQAAHHVVVDYDLLLEESWFFGNLLINQKPKMSRCFSDPSPSSSITNISNEIIALATTNTATARNLARAPSLPPNFGREAEEEEVTGNLRRVVTKLDRKVVDEPKEVCCLGKKNEGSQEKEKSSSSSRRCKTIIEPRKNMLVRTQTLPTSMRKVEIVMSQDKEESVNGGIRKPSRQASLNLADILPPRHNKGTSNSRNRAPKNTLMEGFDTDGSREMRRRYQNEKNMRRTLSDLEIEEVQGFKDLGFTFDNKDKLNPNVVNIIPGLQEKKEEDNLGLENKVRRPYLSEAWLAQSYGPPPPPPPPSWALRKSSEDMKAHIKFWARAVASNVRQEC